MHHQLCDRRKEAAIIWRLQALLALIFWCVGQWFSFLNAFWIGSTIACLGNLYMYKKLFALGGARYLANIMRAFYWGQLGKWLFSITLFLIVFQYDPFNAVGVLLGYTIAAFSILAVGPFLAALDREPRESVVI